MITRNDDSTALHAMSNDKQGGADTDLREEFGWAFLSLNGFHTKAELDREWAPGSLSGEMFRAGAAVRRVEAPTLSVPLDEAWAADLIGIGGELSPQNKERVALVLRGARAALARAPLPGQEGKPVGYIKEDARAMLEAGRSVTVNVSISKSGPWAAPIYLDAPAQTDDARDTVLAQAKHALANSFSKDVARDIERRNAIKAIAASLAGKVDL